MNNLKKIKNNTKNAIMINGIFLGPLAETILTDEVVQSIDKTYFVSGILVDLGSYEVDEPSLNIETSNSEVKDTSRKATADQKEKPTKRRRKRKDSKTTETVQEKEVKVETVKKEKSKEVVEIKKQKTSEDKTLNEMSIQAPSLNMLTSAGITEDELLNYLVSYYKKPPTGIPISDFDEDVRALLERARRAAQKKQISFDDLSAELKNIIKSSNPTDTDGDGKADSSLGSGGTADIIGSQILIPIKEKMLDKSILATLEKAKSAYQKPLDGIPFNHLSEEVQQKIDAVDEETHYWKEPVSTIGLLPMINNKNGDMRLVMESNKIYRWDEDALNWIEVVSNSGGEEENKVPTNDPLNTSSILGEFFAYKRQRTFKLHAPYNPGTNQMMVMLNGLLVFNEVDYIEVNNRTVEFKYPLDEDDYVVFALSTTNPASVIVTQMVEIEARIRQIKLEHSYMPNSDSLRVFLNGVQLQEGINGDYTEIDTRTVDFNIDLLPGDNLAFRVETTTVSKNIVNQFALLRTIYSDLAKKVDHIQKQLPQT